VLRAVARHERGVADRGASVECCEPFGCGDRPGVGVGDGRAAAGIPCEVDQLAGADVLADAAPVGGLSVCLCKWPVEFMLDGGRDPVAVMDDQGVEDGSPSVDLAGEVLPIVPSCGGPPNGRSYLQSRIRRPPKEPACRSDGIIPLRCVIIGVITDLDRS
jgi:hypothetical protein